MIKVRVSQVFTREIGAAVAAKKELDGGVPFAKVVETHSQCPSKSAEGDLGWMPQENMNGVFGVELSYEDKGRAIGPIHSQYGYHILILTDIQKLDSGNLKFEIDTPMNKIREVIPEINTLLFEQFKIGFPVLGDDSKETLRTVCKSQNKPLQEVLGFLNQKYQKLASEIEVTELNAKINRKEKLVLLDIREQWEHDIANIPEATLITHQNSEQTLKSLALNDEIVVIDWKGERGESFQNWLGQRGFTNVKLLRGGIDMWATEVDTKMRRYDIDDDEDYRYEDIVPDDVKS